MEFLYLVARRRDLRDPANMVLDQSGKYRFETAAPEYMLNRAGSDACPQFLFRFSGVALERESPWRRCQDE